MTNSSSLPSQDRQVVTVIKRNVHGQETWRYSGLLLERLEDRLILEAYFDRENMNLHGLQLNKGDHFLETYYTNRWYNIFEIHAIGSGELTGWYCNIARPVEVMGDVLSYIDLSLDLLVFPDGRQLVLDEDEFAELEIEEAVRKQARLALQELQAIFRDRMS